VTVKPRYVLILAGLFWVSFAIGVLALWPEPEGIRYWVRGLVFALLELFGLLSLWIGVTATDEQIEGLVKFKWSRTKENGPK
jgi:hypothetical protein